MISFSLIGVGSGEPRQRPIQLVRTPRVAGDHGGTAGSSVALGKQVTDDARVVGQRRGVDRVQRDGSFHIAELPHVVLQSADRCPAEQRVADGL